MHLLLPRHVKKRQKSGLRKFCPKLSQDLTNLFSECQSPVFVCFFPFQGLEISLSVSDFKQGLWHLGKSQISSFPRPSNLHITGG